MLRVFSPNHTAVRLDNARPSGAFPTFFVHFYLFLGSRDSMSNIFIEKIETTGINYGGSLPARYHPTFDALLACGCCKAADFHYSELKWVCIPLGHRCALPAKLASSRKWFPPLPCTHVCTEHIPLARLFNAVKRSAYHGSAAGNV